MFYPPGCLSGAAYPLTLVIHQWNAGGFGTYLYGSILPVQEHFDAGQGHFYIAAFEGFYKLFSFNTDIDFFPNLPSDIEKEVEKSKDNWKW